MRRGLGLASVVLGLSLLTGPAWGASEADLDELNDQISDLASQIESAEAARTEAGADLLAAHARLDDLVGQVQAAEAQLSAIEASISAGASELAELEVSLERFETALASTRLRVADAKEALSEQVVELYINASTASTRLLAFSDASEAAVGFAYVDGAIGDSSRLLGELDILEREEERQQQILDEQRAAQQLLLEELDRQRRSQAEQVAALDALRAEAAQVAEAARAMVASLTAEIAHFEEHKQGLEADAAALEAELAARGSTGTQPSGPLMRPVPGPVTSPFGYRIHPIFGTRKLHTGWDLSAAAGSPIVAAADGVVVSAGWRGGYGNAVVIDHGGGLATLYAHQSSMAVGTGQSVAQGQVIGYVGCTGYCTGAHLHFEVRVNGAPVDPSGYVG